MNLFDEVLHIKNKKDFDRLAIKVFNYQYENNAVYRQWCDLTNSSCVKDTADIPFLPIGFFRTHSVYACKHHDAEDYFMSSGTTSMQRSTHKVFFKQQYLDNTVDCFEQFFDEVENYCYIFLLPNYLEQRHSSLVCMADYFVRKSRYKQSSFFKNDLLGVINLLEENEKRNIPTVLFGVTYALLDLIELKRLNLRHTIVFETGGMKGRRKEMSKRELHQILKRGLGVERIASEYGMCELFSQAYSRKDGIFFCPKQMDVVIRHINDPKSPNLVGHGGVINVIDLANIETCSFIQTEDVGIKYDDNSFSILGRVDNSALRGCNLMYDN